nr:hypothetical protein [Tanacetum cinerariifolium]
MNLLNECCSANPLAQNQPFPGYSSQFTSETSQSLTQPQQVDSSKKGSRKKTKSKGGKNVEDDPVATGRWLPVEEELLATCYLAVSEDNNVGRSQKNETFCASTQFGELMEQELRLKREAAERAFEVQAEKDRTLMRLGELRFLATSTKDLDDADAYWIKKNKMRNDLGDENAEDE